MPTPPPSSPSWFALVRRAIEVVGPEAGRWLDQPNRLLNGESAAEALFTADGRQRVLGVLDRIAAGAERAADLVQPAADRLPDQPAEPPLTEICAVAERALGGHAEDWFELRRKGFGGGTASFTLFTPGGRTRVLGILRKLEEGMVKPAAAPAPTESPDPAAAPTPMPRTAPPSTQGSAPMRTVAPAGPPPTRAEIVELGTLLMGANEFEAWLKQPRLAFDGRTGQDCLIAGSDRRLVKALLDAMPKPARPRTEATPAASVTNAAIFALATRLFGAKADDWLEEQRPLFGGETATFLMYTPSGRRTVMDLLESIARKQPPPPAAEAEVDPTSSAGIFGRLLRLLGGRTNDWLEQARPEFDGQPATTLMTTAAGRQRVAAMVQSLHDAPGPGPTAASHRGAAAAGAHPPADAAKPAQPDDPNSTKRIFELAGTLFGAQADDWLDEERAWFGDRSAVALMVTPTGRYRVMEVLKTLAAGGDPAVPGSEIPNANSVLLLAKMLFADGADRWLKVKRPIFNDQTALELLAVPEGRQLVVTVLKDIRAGKRPA